MFNNFRSSINNFRIIQSKGIKLIPNLGGKKRCERHIEFQSEILREDIFVFRFKEIIKMDLKQEMRERIGCIWLRTKISDGLYEFVNDPQASTKGCGGFLSANKYCVLKWDSAPERQLKTPIHCVKIYCSRIFEVQNWIPSQMHLLQLLTFLSHSRDRQRRCF